MHQGRKYIRISIDIEHDIGYIDSCTSYLKMRTIDGDTLRRNHGCKGESPHFKSALLSESESAQIHLYLPVRKVSGNARSARKSLILIWFWVKTARSITGNPFLVETDR